MLKHIDDIRKSARERAQRRWKNYQIEKNFKASQEEEADKPKEPRPLEPADILHQQKLIKEHATKFESAFIKEIRAIMEGHTQRNVAMYLQSLEARRLKLLKEKLRRLQLSVAKQKINKSSKDLFG
jgi:hypothetical protein